MPGKRLHANPIRIQRTTCNVAKYDYSTGMEADEILRDFYRQTQQPDKAPDWKKKDFDYWYYATYAMHNMGEEYRLWWNARIRDVLLAHQSREEPHAGSWDPKDDK